ncbi:hypothetical protein Tco_1493726 [Tanacetum coccineum]
MVNRYEHKVPNRYLEMKWAEGLDMECMGLFPDARSGSFWLSDVDLLLCYSKVRNIITREIGEPILNNKDQHVLDFIDTKSWEVAFLERVRLL